MDASKSEFSQTREGALETNALIRAISQHRLDALGCVSKGPEGLLRIHQRNIALSEALYPVLHMLEIVVRNRVHATFSEQFDRDDWYDGEWITQGHARLVLAAKAKIVSRGDQVTPDGVVVIHRIFQNPSIGNASATQHHARVVAARQVIHG